MPTYEYRRLDGTTFEVFQKISAPALTEDPETGEPVTRVISGGAGLQFKGDGFYLTDYVRKDKGSESSSSEKPSGAADSAKSDKKAKDTAKSSSTSTKGASSTSGSGSDKS